MAIIAYFMEIEMIVSDPIIAHDLAAMPELHQTPGFLRALTLALLVRANIEGTTPQKLAMYKEIVFGLGQDEAPSWLSFLGNAGASSAVFAERCSRAARLETTFEYVEVYGGELQGILVQGKFFDSDEQSFGMYEVIFMPDGTLGTAADTFR